MKPSNLDDRDREILSARASTWAALQRAARARDDCPQVGDYVDFADGVTRRVSHVWDCGGVPAIATSDGGRFELHPNGTCSFAGAVCPAVPADTLRRTGQTREGRAWFVPHAWTPADNDIDTTIPCAVWQCTRPSDHD